MECIYELKKMEVFKQHVKIVDKQHNGNFRRRIFRLFLLSTQLTVYYDPQVNKSPSLCVRKDRYTIEFVCESIIIQIQTWILIDIFFLRSIFRFFFFPRLKLIVEYLSNIRLFFLNRNDVI